MKLFTSYFAKQNKNPSQNIAYISIAVGNPKYKLNYELTDVKSIKPYGVFGKYHGEEYKRKYFERLDSIGVEKIKKELCEAIGYRDIGVLMCHEKEKNDCHRRMFAEWWQNKTGEIIPEI